MRSRAGSGSCVCQQPDLRLFRPHGTAVAMNGGRAGDEFDLRRQRRLGPRNCAAGPPFCGRQGFSTGLRSFRRCFGGLPLSCAGRSACQTASARRKGLFPLPRRRATIRGIRTSSRRPWSKAAPGPYLRGEATSPRGEATSPREEWSGRGTSRRPFLISGPISLPEYESGRRRHKACPIHKSSRGSDRCRPALPAGAVTAARSTVGGRRLHPGQGRNPGLVPVGKKARRSRVPRALTPFAGSHRFTALAGGSSDSTGEQRDRANYSPAPAVSEVGLELRSRCRAGEADDPVRAYAPWAPCVSSGRRNGATTPPSGPEGRARSPAVRMAL